MIAPLLSGVKITNLDYGEVVKATGKDVFVFLDPPYYSATKSRLYGKNGNLHTGFNHLEFSQTMLGCQHLWLITYDDCTEIRQQFQFAELEDYSVQYGMNNYMQEKAARGAELFISKLPQLTAQANLFT
jgi:DNA adenine methylase